jgi:hypothetical protein
MTTRAFRSLVNPKEDAMEPSDCAAELNGKQATSRIKIPIWSHCPTLIAFLDMNKVK